MHFYIPSLNRVNSQITINHLPTSILRRTTLVVPRDQAAEYTERWGDKVTVHGVPLRVRGIGATRHYIMTQLATVNKVCMLDDDLRFDVRRADKPSSFVVTTDSDVEQMFAALERAITARVPHGSIMTREGGNRQTEDMHNTRMLRILAYHVPTYLAVKVNYGKMMIMEDFATTLALLCAGKPNVVLAHWVHGQGGSGAKGGCSTYRTLQLQAEAAQNLAALYPKFVRLVQKTTKTAWGGGTRMDVQIAWKKAYASSGAKL